MGNMIVSLIAAFIIGWLAIFLIFVMVEVYRKVEEWIGYETVEFIKYLSPIAFFLGILILGIIKL